VSIQRKCSHEDALTVGDILDSCVVHTASSCSDNLCWTPRLLVAVAPWTRSRSPPWCSTVLNHVTNLTTIVVGAGHYAFLLWWWVQHGWWGCHSSSRSQRMMMLLWWVVMWSTYHPVLVRSAASWSCQSLLLLAILISMDGVIHNDGIAHKFQESPIGFECKTLLKLVGKPFMKW
jgi:hypothetical protein